MDFITHIFSVSMRARKLFFSLLLISPYCLAQEDSSQVQTLQVNAADSVVQVLAYDDDTLVNQGTGVVVSEGGVVVTSDHLLKSANTVKIQGHQGAKHSAVIMSRDSSSDVAVLQSTELLVKPAEITTKSVSKFDELKIVGFWQNTVEKERSSFFGLSSKPKFVAQIVEKKQTAKGLMNSYIEGSESFTLFTTIGRGGYGAPLVNRCGQLVGVVRPDKEKTLKQLWQPHLPSGAFVTSLSVILKSLEQLGIMPTMASKPCLSLAEKRVIENNKKQKEIDEEKKKVAKANKEAKKANEQVNKEKEARVEAEKGRSDLESIVSEIDAKAKETETENLKVKEENELLIWYVMLAVVVAALIIFFLLKRRNREIKFAEDALVAASATYSDCMFEGVDALGNPVAFIILGKDLMQREGGLIIGRSPEQSQVVLSDDTVSRKHARLYISEGRLNVVDLDSTGGTRLNGQLVGSDAVVIIAEDDIQFGEVRLRITFSGERK